jgi:hypothetical protein
LRVNITPPSHRQTASSGLHPAQNQNKTKTTLSVLFMFGNSKIHR